eukprot:1825859-Heterocapsa_arctica.AAC.1
MHLAGRSGGQHHGYASQGSRRRATARKPIGLLPMVYRIWAVARNPEARKWTKSKGSDDAWGGKSGAGALDAAFSLRVE